MTPGAVLGAALILNRLTFNATGNDFVVESVVGFVRTESVVQVLGLRRALYSGPDPLHLPTESTPWIRCYTDGILSLSAPNFSGGSWWSQSVRQLVGEINNGSLPTYSSGWGSAEPLTFVQAGGSVPAFSDLLGWSATDQSPPVGGKSYADGTVYEAAAFKDSDVYVSALHGDGLIAGVPLIAVVAGGGGV